MYTTTKPTVYLIDGLNIVRSFLYEFSRSEEEVTDDFLDFLEAVSLDERYQMHTYEVIFDGSFRPVGPLYRGGVHISFTEGDSADQIICERADYLSQTGQRVIAVTDDRQLQDMLRELGVKSLFCRKFYNSLKLSEK
ncbi:NYN domain-containing protein [Candidatus Avelusimicrobium caledoniensis]|uniref:NYN domain-containing protein n=1 Tax=Candidatus Avelusimicrobium caledoniensis TaxID=3416220 RepID=UPI003D0EADFA